MRRSTMCGLVAWGRRLSVAGLAAACLLPGWGWAETSAEKSSPPDLRAWLIRLHEAARLRNYEGTLVTSDVASVSMWRVAHYFDAEQQYERVDALGGEAFTVLRHNDVVHKLWPRMKLAEVEQRDTRARFPALPANSEQRVLDSYEFRPKGMAMVAGHAADVVVLRARDGLRFSQRLWAEQRTGLLLRADVLGPEGQILEWSAFSEVSIGVKPRLTLITDRLRQLDGYRVRRPAVLPTTLDNEGWQVNALPPGFLQVQCAKRSLDPAGGPGAPVVLQAIYSDGLTHVSMFVEPFDPKRHQSEVVGSIGATHTLMLKRDDQWLTVMGDVPLETLRRFSAALERKR